MKSNLRRSGFTLIELLVVIAIIAILMTLLLPAVQAIRESANSLSCKNRLKQLALACSNYEATYKKLPSGMQFDPGQNVTTSDRFRKNWVILILPQMEAQNVADSFDLDKRFVSDPANKTARGTTLKFMQCPSDAYHDREFVGDGGNWARSNYAANGGLGHAHQTVGRSSYGWTNFLRKGVMACNISTDLGKITNQDGTSNTIMLGELRTGISDRDRRGCWAMGTAGASMLFAHGHNGDANGPNPCNYNSDDIEGCRDMPREVTKEECMTCWPSCGSHQATLRSHHSAGGGACCPLRRERTLDQRFY